MPAVAFAKLSFVLLYNWLTPADRVPMPLYRALPPASSCATPAVSFCIAPRFCSTTALLSVMVCICFCMVSSCGIRAATVFCRSLYWLLMSLIFCCIAARPERSGRSISKFSSGRVICGAVTGVTETVPAEAETLTLPIWFLALLKESASSVFPALLAAEICASSVAAAAES